MSRFGLGLVQKWSHVCGRVTGSRRDEAEVPDGRRAEEDVDEQPDVARRPTEHPVTEVGPPTARPPSDKDHPPSDRGTR